MVPSPMKLFVALAFSRSASSFVVCSYRNSTALCTNGKMWQDIVNKCKQSDILCGFGTPSCDHGKKQAPWGQHLPWKIFEKRNSKEWHECPERVCLDGISPQLAQLYTRFKTCYRFFWWWTCNITSSLEFYCHQWSFQGALLNSNWT